MILVLAANSSSAVRVFATNGDDNGINVDSDSPNVSGVIR